MQIRTSRVGPLGQVGSGQVDSIREKNLCVNCKLFIAHHEVQLRSLTAFGPKSSKYKPCRWWVNSIIIYKGFSNMCLLLIDMLMVASSAYYNIFFYNAIFIALTPRKCLYNIFQDYHLFGWHLCISLNYVLNISSGFCQHAHPKFGRNVLALRE